MFGRFSRIIAVAMGAILCFALLLPMAMREHNIGLAYLVVGIFVAYVGANAYLWTKLRGK